MTNPAIVIIASTVTVYLISFVTEPLVSVIDFVSFTIVIT